MTSSKSSIVISSNGLSRRMAAFATTASRRPHSSIACSVRLAAPSGVETDSVLATASPPAARISCDDGLGQPGIAPAAERVTAEVVHDDPRAAARQLQGVTAAHAATGAGHHDDVTVEAQCAHPSPRLVS